MKKLAMCLWGILLLFLFPSSASAHAKMEKSIPMQESELKESPREIRVKFTEKIDTNLSRITLRDEAGKVIRSWQRGEKGTWLVLTVPPLEKGVYYVDWQVVSSDSHMSKGSFRFAVGMKLPKTNPAVTEPVTGKDSPKPNLHEHQHKNNRVNKMHIKPEKEEMDNQKDFEEYGSETWLQIIQMIATAMVGGVVFNRLWLWNRKPVLPVSLRVEQILFFTALLIFFASGMGKVWLLAHPMGYDGSILQNIYKIVTTSIIGTMAWVRPVITGMLVCLNLVFKAERPMLHWCKVALVSGLVITFPLTGHAMKDPWWGLSLLLYTLHFMVGIIWFGGIAGITLYSFSCKRNWESLQIMHNLLKRFSKIALACVLVLIVSGSILSVLRVGSWHGLNTQYGTVLLCKIIIFFLTFLVVVFHRYFILPKMINLRLHTGVVHASLVRLLFWCLRAELFLLFIVLVIAGFLSTTSP